MLEFLYDMIMVILPCEMETLRDGCSTIQNGTILWEPYHAKRFLRAVHFSTALLYSQKGDNGYP